MEPREVCRVFRCRTSTSASPKFLGKVERRAGLYRSYMPSFRLFVFVFFLRVPFSVCHSGFCFSNLSRFLLSHCLCFRRCVPRPGPCPNPTSSDSRAKRRFVGMGQGHVGSVGAAGRLEHCPRVSLAGTAPHEPTDSPNAGSRARPC